ncbi:hypothetical protein ABZU32_34210 [Sphaerisporangium sp. NPDC005288]|uniref:fascin domain-containing protein n=1 Tax=Sphaerisporangium sp. NPDC005288 TaxID=3155114 RepID=UPI0033B19A6A
MKARNVFRKLGMTVAVGALVLTATPTAIADTTPTPAAGKTFADFLQQHDAAQRAAATCTNVYIQSPAMVRYWSTRSDSSGYTGSMLSATSTSVGGWQFFRVCQLGGGNYSFSAYQTGKYVSAELDYPGADYGMLRARADSVGDWERFRIACSGNLCTIQSAKNGKYVSAEYAYAGSGYGMLRARADSAAEWEKFYIYNYLG